MTVLRGEDINIRLITLSPPRVPPPPSPRRRRRNKKWRLSPRSFCSNEKEDPLKRERTRDALSFKLFYRKPRHGKWKRGPVGYGTKTKARENDTRFAHSKCRWQRRAKENRFSRGRSLSADVETKCSFAGLDGSTVLMTFANEKVFIVY